MVDQSLVTGQDCVAELALFVVLVVLVDIVDVHPQSVGLDKLLGAGGTLVLQLGVVLHLVSHQLVQPRHHGGTQWTLDTERLLLRSTVRYDQLHSSMSNIVDSEVSQSEEHLLTPGVVTLERGRSERC